MGLYNEELVNAGILLAGEGLNPAVPPSALISPATAAWSRTARCRKT
jgi:hypothetical protein